MAKDKKDVDELLGQLRSALAENGAQSAGLYALLRKRGLEDPTIPLDIVNKTRVTPTVTDENTLAYVLRRDPKNIRINVKASQFPSNTLRHELEHVFQNAADDRYENNMYSQDEEERRWRSFEGIATNELAKLKGVSSREAVYLIRDMLTRGNNPAVRKRLKELNLPTDSAYLGQRDTVNWLDQVNLRETLAELRSLEEQNNIDLARDPVLGPMIFGDQDLVDWYHGVTGLRTNRLDAKDLPPMTPQRSQPKPEKGWLDKFKELFR